MKISSILVVCTGNICRSPIAEWLLKEQLSSGSVSVDSAGTMAMVGAQADPSSVASMLNRGYLLGSHRAKQLDGALLGKADLVLALDRTHRAWISKHFPQYLGRTFKLGYWDGDADVADPYRKSQEMFTLVHRDIERYVSSWMTRLGKLTASR